MFIAIIKAEILPNMHTKLRDLSSTLKNHVDENDKDCQLFEFFIDGDTYVVLERWGEYESMQKSAEGDLAKNLETQMRNCVVNGTFELQHIESNKFEVMIV